MSKKIKYIIKSCPSDDTQALQNLLNEMSMNGWELYSMNEVETEDEKIMFNCIFMIEENDSSDMVNSDIMNWATVKNPIEKMISPEMTPYEQCIEIIDKIKSQKKKIAKIKSALDFEAPASDGRKEYNDKISSSLKDFENLKKDLVNISNPDNMYQRLGVDVLSMCVSEELIALVDTESEDKECLYPELVKMRCDSIDNYGYIIPSIRILDSSNLSPYEFVINVRSLEVFKASAYPNHKMFFLEDLNDNKKIKDAIYDIDLITGRDIVWIDRTTAKDYWSQGMTAAEFITRAISFISVRYVDELFSYNTLEKYCDIVEADNPCLIENIVPDVVSFADLRYIFTSLISEKVPIKDISYLFTKLNDFADDSSRADLLNKIRIGLSRSICKQYVDDDNCISAVELSDKTFEKIIPSVEEDNNVVKIDSDFSENLAKKLIKKVVENELEIPILIAPIEYRQMLFSLIVHYVNDVVVLAREEIGSNCKLDIVDEI